MLLKYSSTYVYFIAILMTLMINSCKTGTVVAAPAPMSPTVIPSDYGKCVSLQLTLTLCWTVGVNGDSTIIEFGVLRSGASVSGWTGIGIGSSRMQGSSFLVGQTGNNNAVNVSPYFGTRPDNFPDTLSSSSFILNQAGVFDPGAKSISFKVQRHLASTNAMVAAIQSGSMDVIWAFGSGTFGYHGDNFGSTKVVFVDSNSHDCSMPDAFSPSDYPVTNVRSLKAGDTTVGTFYWAVRDGGILEMSVTRSGRAWFGIGLGSSVMQGADFVVGVFRNDTTSQVSLFNYYGSAANSFPMSRGICGIRACGGFFDGKVTTIRVQRLLSDTQNFANDLSMGGLVSATWASASPSSSPTDGSLLGYHGTNKGSFSFPINSLNPVIDASYYGDNIALLSAGIKLYWKISPNNIPNVIELALSRPGRGWIGFGIGSSEMKGASILVGEVLPDSTDVVVKSMYGSISNGPPALRSNSTYEILASGGQYDSSKNITSMKVWRNLKSSLPLVTDIVEGVVPVIWAFNDPKFSMDTIGYHGNNRGDAVITFINKSSICNMTPDVVPSFYSGNQVLNPSVTLYWKVNPDQLPVSDPSWKAIEIAMVKSGPKSWIGLGIGSTVMTNSDMVIAQFEVPGNSNNVFVSRYYGKFPNSAPLNISFDGILGCGGQYNAKTGTTSFKLRRPLKSDCFSSVLDVPLANVPVIWAYADTPSLQLSYHGSNRGSTTVQFVSSNQMCFMNPEIDPNYYPNFQSLSKDMFLYWKVNLSSKIPTIEFALQRRGGRSWIGMGVGSLRMQGSDFLIGEFSSNLSNATGLFVSRYFGSDPDTTPSQSSSAGIQDCGGYYNSTSHTTTIKVIRALSSPDFPTDISTPMVAVPIVWAYSSDGKATSLSYHGDNKGFTNLVLVKSSQCNLSGFNSTSYDHSADLGGRATLYWKVFSRAVDKQDIVEMAVSMPEQQGWFGIGVGSMQMNGASYFIAEKTAQNGLSVKRYASAGGNHAVPLSTDGSGLLNCGGSFASATNNNTSTFRYQLLYSSVQSVATNSYLPLIWAWGGTSQGSLSIHSPTNKGSATINLNADGADTNTDLPWQIPLRNSMLAISATFFCICVGILMQYDSKSRQYSAAAKVSSNSSTSWFIFVLLAVALTVFIILLGAISYTDVFLRGYLPKPQVTADTAMFVAYLMIVSLCLSAHMVWPSPILRQRIAMSRSWKLWISDGLSWGELIIVSIFIIFQIGWFSYFYQSIKQSPVTSSLDTIEIVARALGHCNDASIALLLLPVTRNSLWTAVFGIPFERAIRYHRWLARLAMVYVTLHLALWWYQWSRGLSGCADSSWVSCAFNGASQLERAWTVIYATIAWILMVLTVFVFALAYIRRSNWDLFYVMHHVFIIILAFAALHSGSILKYMLLGVGLYMFDRVMRILRPMHHRTSIITMHSESVEVTRLRMRVDGDFEFSPGQYAFVNIPSISRWEWHPFTVSSAPIIDDGKQEKKNDCFVNFHIKNMGERQWTGRLAALAQANPSFNGPCYIDGPYGALSISFDNQERLILVAGGIGFTPIASILSYLLYRKNHGSYPDLKKVYVLWTVKRPACLVWFQDLLVEVSHSRHFPCVVGLYVTHKSAISNEEGRAMNSGQHRLLGADGNEVSEIEMETEVLYSVGRPNLKSYFNDLSIDANFSRTKTGVVVCGPPSMVVSVITLSHSHHFNVHSESFEL